MFRLIGRADGAGLSPAGDARVRHDLYDRGVKGRMSASFGHPLGPSAQRQFHLVDVNFSNAHGGSPSFQLHCCRTHEAGTLRAHFLSLEPHREEISLNRSQNERHIQNRVPKAHCQGLPPVAWDLGELLAGQAILELARAGGSLPLAGCPVTSSQRTRAWRQ